jgi:hypothetical protein
MTRNRRRRPARSQLDLFEVYTAPLGNIAQEAFQLVLVGAIGHG